MIALRRAAPAIKGTIANISCVASAFAIGLTLSSPASALDLSKLQNPFGADWQAKAATRDLVRFICATPACPPSGEVAIAIRPAPDAARDEVIGDPAGTLAGYEKGFRNNPANKACEFSDFFAKKAGEQGSRIEMRGECPSGLVLMMATMFDKRQPGTISVVASSMDGPKAGALRARSRGDRNRA